MLFFVDFARRAGFVIDDYVDEAEGVLEKRADGKMAMTASPPPAHHWGGEAPDDATSNSTTAPRGLLHRQLCTTDVTVGYRVIRRS